MGCPMSSRTERSVVKDLEYIPVYIILYVNEILRKAQDDKESLRLFVIVMTIGGEKVILYMVIRN